MEHYFYSIHPKTGEQLIPIVYKEWEKAALLAVADSNGYIPYELYVTAMAEIIKLQDQKKKQN